MNARRRPRAITWALLSLTLCTAAIASAQTYQGTMRGLVRDAQGVIPGAEITIVNEATNAERMATSNEVGEYIFSSVLPGTYTIRVSLPGFRTEERKSLRLATQQQLVQDFTMEVGGLSEQITVTGEAPLVERATATMATSLGAKEISALPIFGRNTFYAAISTPNVIQSGDPQFVRYQDQSNASFLSLGGGPRRGNAYLVEGVSITDFLNRPSWVPSTEAIEDMRVQVKTYEADMGRAAGGVFNVTAKSGSNQWHGTALLLNKPEWASGQLFFAKRAGSERPPQYYYSWAGSVGGPVAKDKTFFWFSKDDYTQRSTRNNVINFPTALERTGDFSQSRNAAGQQIVIYDPLTTRPNPSGTGFIRDPFPGNVIPLDRMNPVALAMLANMPMPGSGRLFNGQATLDDGPQAQETLKVDQRWSSKWTTTGVYGHQSTIEPSSAFWGAHGSVAGDPGGGTLYRDINFIALNNIFIPNNNTAIAVRYGYNHFRDNGGNFLDFDAASLGFPASYVSSLPFNTFPNITLTGYGGIGNNGPSVTTHISQTANATATRFLGSHSLKLGADYRRMQARSLVLGASAGAFTFNQGFTQGPTPTTAGTASGDTWLVFFWATRPAAN